MSAVIQNEYTGNGSTTTYSFTFPYLKTSDIKASLDGVETTAFTLPNATTLQFNNGATPPVAQAPANGAKIKIFRETSVDDLTATFYAGSAIKSEDLNDNFTQNLFKTQEVSDRALNTLGDSMTGDLTLGPQASLVFEGSTDDANETTIAITDPTADRTITLPNETGEVVLDTLPSAKIFVGDSNNKVSEVTVTGDIAIDSTGAVTIQPDAVESGMIGENVITTSEVDGSLVNANIASDAAILGTKISPDFGAQNISTTGTINSLTTTELAILDGATVSTDELNILDGVTATKDEINILDGVTATKDEINILDGVTATKDEINILDGVTATKDEINILDGVTATKDEINILDGVTATATEINLLDGVTATTTELNYVDGVTSAIQTQLDGKQGLDTELTTLAGMQSGTASKLADSTALTADIADLNQIDGLTKQASTNLTNTDSSFPTSAAVVNYVAGQIAPLGGLEVVATDAAFPYTQPASGVVISISDAGGVAFNGSGTSTTGRTVTGPSGEAVQTVTINNAPSSLNNETLVAGVGLMVSSTGSGQIYNYHKILGKEDDIKQLSDDINDFNARYRVGTASDLTGLASGTLDGGDLFFNTTTGKLLVYNNVNTAWEEAQSIGNFFISTLSPAFDNNTQDFTITNAPTTAQQILLSINGVVQKPNSGTSTPSEGFALSGSTVKLAAAPASGSIYHAVVLGSTVNIGTPSDNTVDTDILMSGAVTDAKVSTTAAIAGTKISPNFGSQNVATTGTLASGDITLTDVSPSITFIDSNDNPDFSIFSNTGELKFKDDTNNVVRMKINADGHVDVIGKLDVGGSIHVTGTNTLSTDGIQTSFSAPEGHIKVKNSTGAPAANLSLHTTNAAGTTNRIMHLTHDGKVGINTAPATAFHLYNDTSDTYFKIQRAAQGTGQVALDIDGGTSSHRHIIYMPEDSNDLRFYVTGINKDAISIRASNAYVGIGEETVPNNYLSVKSTSSSSCYITTERGAKDGGQVGIQIKGGSGGKDWYFYQHTNENILRIYNTSDANLIEFTETGMGFTAGKGISFAADQGSGATSSLLDDYEEGDWDPKQSAGGTNYSHNHAKYVKIGQFVFLDFDITNDSGATKQQIFGLPYSVSNYGSWTISWYGVSGGSTAGNLTRAQGGLVENTSNSFQTRAAGGNQGWNIGNGDRFIGTAVYRTST